MSLVIGYNTQSSSPTFRKQTYTKLVPHTSTQQEYGESILRPDICWLRPCSNAHRCTTYTQHLIQRSRSMKVQSIRTRQASGSWPSFLVSLTGHSCAHLRFDNGRTLRMFEWLLGTIVTWDIEMIPLFCWNIWYSLEDGKRGSYELPWAKAHPRWEGKRCSNLVGVGESDQLLSKLRETCYLCIPLETAISLHCDMFVPWNAVRNITAIKKFLLLSSIS